MWNALAPHLQGGPPQGAPPQAAPPPRPMPPHMQPSSAPPPNVGNAPPPNVGNALPPQGGPPPQAGAQPGGTDPAVAQVLIARAKTLTPQESQTFETGISVPALQVLKKMLPEIAPAIDQTIAKKQGGGGAPMPGAAPPGAPPMPPPQAAPPPQAMPPRPVSGLRSV